MHEYPSIYNFTFTGKERDEETGYTYHGARYFDAALLTSWMAVDPMSDKYPSLSPYNYCAWNPLVLIDDNGEDASIPPELARFGYGFAQSLGGILTIGGGLAMGVLGSETVVCPVLGFALVCDGSYSTLEGIHKMANVIAGRPASEDPKYSTVAGAVTKNTTVDNVTSGAEALLGNGANTVVKIATRKAKTASSMAMAPKTSSQSAPRSSKSTKQKVGTGISHGVTGVSTGAGHYGSSQENKKTSSNKQSSTNKSGKSSPICKELRDA